MKPQTARLQRCRRHDDKVVIGNLFAFDATWNSYTLGQYVEHLDARLSTEAVMLNGNGLGNEILGNASANTLVGGAGNDTLDVAPARSIASRAARTTTPTSSITLRMR